MGKSHREVCIWHEGKKGEIERRASTEQEKGRVLFGKSEPGQTYNGDKGQKGNFSLWKKNNF